MRQLAIALLGLVLAIGAQAQSLKEKYELSERCGRRAEEVLEPRAASMVHHYRSGAKHRQTVEPNWKMPGSAGSCNSLTKASS